MPSKGNYDVIFITWYNGPLIAQYTSQETNAKRPPFIYLETRLNWTNSMFITKCVNYCSLQILLHVPINTQWGALDMHSGTSCRHSFKAVDYIFQSKLKLKCLDNFSNIIEFHENPSSCSFELLHVYRLTQEQKEIGFILTPRGDVQAPRTITHGLVETHTAF